MLEEETGYVFAKACAKLTSYEMAVMVQRALAVYQASVESKSKVQKIELPPIGMLLEGPATYLTEEESQIRLQARAAGLLGVKSALAVSNSDHTGNTWFRGESRRCYICCEVGHLKLTCHKSPKKRDAGERGQSGYYERGRGGQRGGRVGNWANLMVAKEEKQAIVGLSEKDLIMEIVRRRKKGASEGKSAVADTLALAFIPTTRSSDWIVDSGSSRHVTGDAREFSSYTHLAVPDNIQTADGTVQPMVGKGTVRCTNSVTLTNVLHAHSFPVNLVSISSIIQEQKCIVIFDIPTQEKGTGWILGTGTWRDGLLYKDRKGMDTALASVVDRVEARGSGVSVEDEFLLIH